MDAADRDYGSLSEQRVATIREEIAGIAPRLDLPGLRGLLLV